MIHGIMMPLVCHRQKVHSHSDCWFLALLLILLHIDTLSSNPPQHQLISLHPDTLSIDDLQHQLISPYMDTLSIALLRLQLISQLFFIVPMPIGIGTLPLRVFK